MKRIKSLTRLACSLVSFALLLGTGSALAQFAGPMPLTLINGWTNNTAYSTSIATVEEVAGIVQFRGAIASGTTAEPFTLPAWLTPATEVYIPINLCNAANGRLDIYTNGTVSIETQGAFSDAQCLTSLDGASFALNSTGFKGLTLINGWTNAPFGTSDAEVRNINGIVHFKGAIATTGTNSKPFVLPSGFRPVHDVYVPVDLCDASNGRLYIQHTGVVNVEAEGGTFSNAQCFTSLDGAWFVVKDTGYTALKLINGWTNGPLSTNVAKAGNAYGIVYFQGAVATSGTNTQPFVLPPSLSPVTNVYIPVDLCDATKGQLFIQVNGFVTVQAETVFSNAQCFTSLDGVSYVQ